MPKIAFNQEQWRRVPAARSESLLAADGAEALVDLMMIENFQ